MNVNSFLKQVREGYSPSKAEEINLLDALNEAFLQKNAYLTSLFTFEFVEWVRQAIRQDTSADMWGAMQHAKTAIPAELDSKRAEIAHLNDRIASLECQLERTEDSLIAARQGITDLEETVQEKREVIGKVSSEAAGLHNKIAALYEMAMRKWVNGESIAPEELRDALGS